MSILDQIREAFTGRSGVQIVADDPDLMAELLLLVRLMFADGVLRGEERETFDLILETSFGIPGQDVPDVLKFLVDFGYETTPAQALETFANTSVERRENLLKRMAEIARADSRLHPREVEMLERTARHLGIGTDRVAEIVLADAPATVPPIQ